jgi:hypothetical protein
MGKQESRITSSVQPEVVHPNELLGIELRHAIVPKEGYSRARDE